MKLPSRTTGLVTSVLALTIAGGLAWNAYWARQPDIDDVGGTILVYQLDKQLKNAGPNLMAEALERRFAFDGMRHVTVRPGQGDEIEVRIPRVGDHAADVRAVKFLVAQAGRLEFRILANGHDDAVAIEATERLINHARELDPKLEQELRDAQQQGLPPPGPREPDGQPRKFHLTLAHRSTSTVSYSWVELGPPEQHALNLDRAAGDDPQRGHAWKEASAHRGEALKLPEPSAAGEKTFLLQGALFYSRACEDRHLAEQERRDKEVDYFVLARDPEFDPVTGQRTAAVDGSYLASVFADRDATGRPIVAFTLNPAGAELFATLTRKNSSEFDVARKWRHLAIVLDGRVVSAPTINSEIHDRGTISGAFTPRQVLELVSILGAGALPGALLPRPVREVVVEPRK
jgi:preprotein translocase subunit SecD